MGDHQTHIASLFERYANRRSVKEVERAAGLKEGSLGYYLKPSSTGRKRRVPALDVMERWARALDAPLEEVSQAFVRDAKFDTGETFDPQEIDLIHRYRALCDTDQARLIAIIDTFERLPHRENA